MQQDSGGVEEHNVILYRRGRKILQKRKKLIVVINKKPKIQQVVVLGRTQIIKPSPAGNQPGKALDSSPTSLGAFSVWYCRREKYPKWDFVMLLHRHGGSSKIVRGPLRPSEGFMKKIWIFVQTFLKLAIQSKNN